MSNVLTEFDPIMSDPRHNWHTSKSIPWVNQGNGHTSRCHEWFMGILCRNHYNRTVDNNISRCWGAKGFGRPKHSWSCRLVHFLLWWYIGITVILDNITCLCLFAMVLQDRWSWCGWSSHGKTNNFLNNLMPIVMWAGVVQTRKNSNGIFKVVISPEPARSLSVVWFWEKLNCECKKGFFLSALLITLNARALEWSPPPPPPKAWVYYAEHNMEIIAMLVCYCEAPHLC